MNAPVQSNMKAQLLQNTVEHVDITSFDARPIIDSMRKMSFSSRDTARAADIFNMALEDKDCSPWLILAGSTSAGGCMHVYRDMVKFGMIDAVVATGASIVDMDFFEALGFKHYQAAGTVDEARQVQQALGNILGAVGGIVEQNQQIAAAVEQQTAVAHDIDMNIVEINQAGERTAEGAVQTEQASRQLSDQVARLKELISAFRV